MTREEAIERMKIIKGDCYIIDNPKDKEAFDMSISALEQQSCDDAIDRAEAMTEIMMFAGNVKPDEEDIYIKVSDAVQLLRELPSVTQKSGKWIKRTDRLPEDKTYVLTTIKVPNRVAHARSGWYEGGFFHNDNGDTWRATDMEVKAWMPLPEPYEPQESEE